jgi:hypothetical protein
MPISLDLTKTEVKKFREIVFTLRLKIFWRMPAHGPERIAAKQPFHILPSGRKVPA